MAVFVGKDRQQTLEALAARYDRCVDEGSPHITCLVAEAGWGKTRVVQELYGWLQRERQPDGVYWPADLAPPRADPMRSRKVIYPEHVETFPDIAMPWLWWGLRCEQDSGGRKLRALLNDGVQMRGHLAALVEIAARQSGDRDLAMTVLGEAIGFIPGLGQIASAVVTAKSLVPRLYDRLFAGIERARERRAQASRTVDLMRADTTEVESQLALVRQFVSKELPLVLAIDDAHEADPGTVEFIYGAMRLQLPILIICTAWPSTLADQVEEELELDPSERVSFGSLLQHLEVERPDQVSRVELEPLEASALGELVREVAPKTSPERERTLVATSGSNPLVLRLQVTSPKVLRSVVGDAITLSTEELERIPRGFERLIGERFDELAERDQRWLAEAALQGDDFLPSCMSAATDDLDEERISAFVRVPVGDWVVVGRFVEPPVRRAILAAAEAEYSKPERAGWERTTLTMLLELRRAGGVVDETEAFTVWCRLVLRLAEEHADAVHPDPATLTGAALGLSFAERDLDHHREELLAAEAGVRWAERGDCGDLLRGQTRTRLAAALRANNERAAAVEQARAAVELLEGSSDSPGMLLFDALQVLAGAQMQHNDVEGARAAVLSARKVAAEGPQTILALQILAGVEEASNDVPAAHAALAEALRIAQGLDPPDIELVIEIETDITDLDPFLGAVERWEEHLKAVEERLGTGHWLYRYCLGSLVQRQLVSGDLAAAHVALDRFASLPEAHDDSTLALLQAMIAMYESGDSNAVSTQLSMLSSAPYSPVQSSRTVAAIAAAITGRVTDVQGLEGPFGVLPLMKEDVDEAMEWLAERIRIGGSSWSGEAKVFAAQIGAGLLGDRLLDRGSPSPMSPALVEQVSGLIAADVDFPGLARQLLRGYLDALDVLEGRDVAPLDESQPPIVKLRAWLQRAVAAHAGGKRELSEELLARARAEVDTSDGWLFWQVLGIAHATCDSPFAEAVWRDAADLPDATELDRLIARSKHGVSLYRSGRMDEAEAVERTVMEGRRELLGDEDSRTLDAITSLAYTLKARSQDEEARDLEREVVDGCVRSLGERHRRTTNAKAALASTLTGLGDHAAARPLREDVAKVLGEELGDDDPAAVDAQVQLARVLVAVGDASGAAPLFEDALVRRRAALGDEHERTLEIMAQLADVLALDERERASELAEQVLAVRSASAGPDDPGVRAAKLDLAHIRSQQGDTAGAAELERDVVASCTRALGRTAPATLEAMRRLAVRLYNLKQFEAARELEEEVLATRERNLNSAVFGAVRAGDTLADTLWKLDDKLGAIACREYAMRRMGRFAGDGHPECLRIRGSLVDLQVAAGQLEPARGHLARMLEIQRETLGHDAAPTLETASRLATVEQSLAEAASPEDSEDESAA